MGIKKHPVWFIHVRLNMFESIEQGLGLSLCLRYAGRWMMRPFCSRFELHVSASSCHVRGCMTRKTKQHSSLGQFIAFCVFSKPKPFDVLLRWCMKEFERLHPKPPRFHRFSAQKASTGHEQAVVEFLRHPQ